jgi:hypothetical protein
MTNEHDQPAEGDELLHSVPIARAINDAIDVTDWIRTMRPKELRIPPEAGMRTKAAATFFLIAIDHGEALSCLIRFDYRSSAFALLRPTIDSYLYGLWIQICQEDQLKRFTDSGVLPSVEKAASTFDKSNNAGLRNLKNDLYGALDHYVHGGWSQLQAWSKGQVSIEQNHSESDTVNLMAVNDLFRLAACSELMKIAGNDGQNAASDLLVKRLMKRLPPLTGESLGHRKLRPIT